MSKALGRLVQFGIAKESVRGTPETAASFWIPWKDLVLDEVQEDIINQEAYGVIEDSFGRDIAKQYVKGSLTAPISDKHFALILLNVLGTLNTAANADGSGTIKDHTITVGQSAQHQALSLFLDDPAGGQDYKHGLGMIEQLEISYELGQYITYKIDFKAKKGATATLTPATSTENRFTHKHVTFKLASNLAGLGAASGVTIKSFKLVIKTNLEDDFVLGSVDPADFLNKQISIEGSVTALWQNESDYKTAFLANTNKAMRIDIQNTDVTIGTSANPLVRIDLAKCYFTALGRPFKLNDLITQDLSFKAVYSISDTKAITCLVTNAQASY